MRSGVTTVRYWEDRARQYAAEGNGLRAVCSYGMPGFYNAYIHATQYTALRSWLRPSAGTRVLEIGCGVGRWSRRLARAGALVTGIDLSEVMVREAIRRARLETVDDRCTFAQGDVVNLALGQSFDLILCVTVLQHIAHPEGIREALDRMRVHLAPEGRLVLLEAAPCALDERCDSSTFIARTESFYREAFLKAGLRCISMRGVDPLRLKSSFLPWYRRLPAAAGKTVLFGITAVSLPCDLALAPFLPSRSWHKLFVLGAS